MASDYKRPLLRAWVRFAKDGEIYEALKDIPVLFLTHWQAPFTGGREGVLRKGTRVRVCVHSFNPEPIGVAAQPIDASLEKELVETDVLAAGGYAGFSLSIGTDQLNRAFMLFPQEDRP